MASSSVNSRSGSPDHLSCGLYLTPPVFRSMGSVALRSTSVSPIVTLGTRTLITQVSTLPDSRRQIRTDCAPPVLGAHSIGCQRPRSALKNQRNRLPPPAHFPTLLELFSIFHLDPTSLAFCGYFTRSPLGQSGRFDLCPLFSSIINHPLATPFPPDINIRTWGHPYVSPVP